MKRIFTAVAAGMAASADINNLQDQALGLVAASKNNDLGTYSIASFGIVWQANASIAASTFLQIDDSIDWRDRLLWGQALLNTGADNRAGQAADTDLDSFVANAGLGNPILGYTGVGGYSTVAGAAVSNGNPPVRGVGAKRSYYVDCGATSGAGQLWADPTTGGLYLYNHTGFTAYPTLYLFATGKLGKR